MLLSATTLVRPAFFLLPFFLAFAMPLLARSQRSPRALRGWGLLVVTASLTMLPWFTYNYVNLGQFTLSPAGGIGRGLWEGSWQGVWPGRVQAQLTALAEENSGVERIVSRRSRPKAASMPGPCCNTCTSGGRSTISGIRRRIRWNAPAHGSSPIRVPRGGDRQHPARSTRAYSAANHQGNVRSLGGDIPIRYSDINGTPVIVIRMIWLIQVAILLLAIVGIVTLARRGRWTEALVLTLPLIYVTGVHLPLLCEARQSLPVKPLVLTLAAVGLLRPTSPGTAGS